MGYPLCDKAYPVCDHCSPERKAIHAIPDPNGLQGVASIIRVELSKSGRGIRVAGDTHQQHGSCF